MTNSIERAGATNSGTRPSDLADPTWDEALELGAQPEGLLRNAASVSAMSVASDWSPGFLLPSLLNSRGAPTHSMARELAAVRKAAALIDAAKQERVLNDREASALLRFLVSRFAQRRIEVLQRHVFELGTPMRFHPSTYRESFE